MTRKDETRIADLIEEAYLLGIFTEKRRGLFVELTLERLTIVDEYQFRKDCGVVR